MLLYTYVSIIYVSYVSIYLPVQLTTHLVLIVPLLVTTPSITLDPNVPSLEMMSSTEQFSITLAPDRVENL